MHTPSMAAMVTTSIRFSIIAAVSWNIDVTRKPLLAGRLAGSASAVAESYASFREASCGNSTMSSPAQNVLPAPRKIRTRASSSKRTRRTASCSSFCIDTDKQLCFSGRLNVTVYTGPSLSTRKSSSNSIRSAPAPATRSRSARARCAAAEENEQ